MNLEDLKAELERDEGRVPYAYQDSLGYWTCGVGFLIDRQKGGRIPDAVIDFWLDYEIKEKASALQAHFPWFLSLDDVRQNAIVNMAYNLGISGISNFHRMLSALQEHDFDKAADEMAESKWAHQVGDRATRLITMMRTGQ